MKPVNTYHPASKMINSKSSITPPPIILKEIPHDIFYQQTLNISVCISNRWELFFYVTTIPFHIKKK